ncbi:hypothetical protein [Immundisolibacter sp.]|uniref:hypothetical protein n=1 Tax=Immundisolibacter sp. TaxID=1934948 RepID=UPI00356612ED
MQNEATPNLAPHHPLHLLSLALCAVAVLAWLVPIVFASNFAYPNLHVFAWQLVLTHVLLAGGLFAHVAAEGRLAGHGRTTGEQHAPAPAASPAIPKSTPIWPEHCAVLSCQNG